MRLDPGGKVLLFTDGITEATNSRGEEYGENRLRQRFDIDERDTATMHREIMQEVSDFCLWQSCG
jgi:serine phosphatase RsbU (regulator of sigma subunit)